MTFDLEVMLRASDQVFAERWITGDEYTAAILVVWSRSIPRPGLPSGMGVRLLAPPPAYTSYVSAL